MLGRDFRLPKPCSRVLPVSNLLILPPFFRYVYSVLAFQISAQLANALVQRLQTLEDQLGLDLAVNLERLGDPLFIRYPAPLVLFFHDLAANPSLSWFGIGIPVPEKLLDQFFVLLDLLFKILAELAILALVSLSFAS